MQVDVKKKLDQFFAKTAPKKYRKGQLLVSPDQDSAIFFLTEGIVKRYAISANGEELTLNLYKNPSFFPLEYALNIGSHNHYYEAMSDVVVYKTTSSQFLEFMRQEPEILIDLLSRIYTGLNGFFQRMEYLMAGNASHRLITELIIFAKRFGQKMGQNALINIQITEKELASLTGITRETVSREIHKLKTKELISFDKGTLVINDLKKLEESLFEA